MLRRVHRAVYASLLPALILAACSSIPDLDETAEPPSSLPAGDSSSSSASEEASVTTRPLQVEETVVLGPVQSTLLADPGGTDEAEDADSRASGRDHDCTTASSDDRGSRPRRALKTQIPQTLETLTLKSHLRPR